MVYKSFGRCMRAMHMGHSGCGYIYDFITILVRCTTNLVRAIVQVWSPLQDAALERQTPEGTNHCCTLCYSSTICQKSRIFLRNNRIKSDTFHCFVLCRIKR